MDGSARFGDDLLRMGECISSYHGQLVRLVLAGQRDVVRDMANCIVRKMNCKCRIKITHTDQEGSLTT